MHCGAFSMHVSRSDFYVLCPSEFEKICEKGQMRSEIDQEKASELYKRVQDCCTAALANGGPWNVDIGAWDTNEQGWTPHEIMLLEHAVEVASAFEANRKPDREKMAKAESISLAVIPEQREPSTWAFAVSSIVKEMHIGRVKGTGRELGPGIMAVASQLWGVVPNDEVNGTSYEVGQELHYVSFLVEPLLVRLKALEFSPSKDGLPLLLTMIDAVRAILYVATVHGPPDGAQMQEAFDDFLDVRPVDAQQLQELATVQKKMLVQGWGLLCFRVLQMETLPDLHLPCIQLLLALTGGANADAQDIFLAQLNDDDVCPVELCASVCRRCLRDGVMDLKHYRRATKDAPSGTGLNLDELPQHGHALCILQCMENLCTGAVPHDGMQNYLERQPGHDKEISIITDVVYYLAQIERDVRAAVLANEIKSAAVQEGAAKLLSLVQVEKAVKDGKQAVVALMLERCKAALRVLIALIAGPEEHNRQVLGATNALIIVNRILNYCQYTFSDVAGESIGLAEKRPRRQLNTLMGSLLLTMLEGTPPMELLQKIINDIDWKLIRNIMRNFKSIMTEGKIYQSDRVERDDESADEDNVPASPRSSNAASPRSSNADYILPVLDDADRAAQWITREAHTLTTVVQKLVSNITSGCKTQREADQLLEPMHPLLNDVSLKFFRERILEVEVVDDGQLQRLFFDYSSVVDPDQREDLKKDVIAKMDRARRDTEENRVSDFIEGLTEVIMMTMRMDAKAVSYPV